MRPELRVVEKTPAAHVDRQPEAMLAKLVPELIEAEQDVAILRMLVDSWRRALAAERGVAFIRDEAVRREFGSKL
jgi:hypothetical protein